MNIDEKQVSVSNTSFEMEQSLSLEVKEATPVSFHSYKPPAPTYAVSEDQPKQNPHALPASALSSAPTASANMSAPPPPQSPRRAAPPAEQKEMTLEELEAAIRNVAQAAIDSPQLETLVHVYTKLEPFVPILRERHAGGTDARVVQLHNSLVVFMLEIRQRMQNMIPLSTYYRLDRHLRDCIGGKVFFATDTRNNRECAVKLLSQEALHQKQQLENVQRETQIMKILSERQAQQECPNVIRMYDTFTEGDKIYIAMEYCSGGELYNLVCRHRMHEHDARRIFRQILTGLQYIHQAGIAHLDISPENVLLDHTGTAKIIDFGLSAPIDRCPAGQRGKIRYMAPEVFSGQRYEPLPADVYSCGVTLFVMLCAALPYRLPTRMDNNFRLLNEGRISDCFAANPTWHRPSVHAMSLLQSMLLPQNHRPSVAQLLAHPWFTANLV